MQMLFKNKIHSLINCIPSFLFPQTNIFPMLFIFSTSPSTLFYFMIFPKFTSTQVKLLPLEYTKKLSSISHACKQFQVIYMTFMTFRGLFGAILFILMREILLSLVNTAIWKVQGHQQIWTISSSNLVDENSQVLTQSFRVVSDEPDIRNFPYVPKELIFFECPKRANGLILSYSVFHSLTVQSLEPVTKQFLYA